LPHGGPRRGLDQDFVLVLEVLELVQDFVLEGTQVLDHHFVQH
jgi:hypothetical protein